MNLKAKLYIFKNHTFLLLSPSSFEHWLESYLCFTEGSLPFSEFAFRSSIVFHESPISSVPLRARVTATVGRFPSFCNAAPPVHSKPHPPPTARAASAVLPSPCHVAPPEPSGCHAPEGTPAPPAVLSSARDRPSLSPSLSHQLSRAIPYKADPNPTFPHLFPLLPPCATEARACSSPEFAATTPPCPNSSRPPLPHLLH
jgi:hypothetical protein